MAQWEEYLPLLRRHVEAFHAQYALGGGARDLEDDVQRALGALQLLLRTRQRAEDLDEVVRRLARRAVDERVVEEMRRDGSSHLWTLNYIWVVQQVCMRLRVPYSRPAAMSTGTFDEVLTALLDSLPEAKHDRVMHASAEICRRIYVGLPGFRRDSNLDTWRTTIVQHTLFSIRAQEERQRQHERVFSELPQPRDHASGMEDAGRQFDAPSTDPTLDEEMTRAELARLLDECSPLVVARRPQIDPMIELIRDGLPAREIAKRLRVEPSKVHQATAYWRRQMRALLKLRNLDFQQRERPPKQRQPRKRRPNPPASPGV